MVRPAYTRTRDAVKNCLSAFGVISLLCLGSCIRYEPRPISPVETLNGYLRRDLTAPRLLQFMESARQRPMRPWPAEFWDLELLTLAALFYHPALDVARAVRVALARPLLTVGAGVVLLA